MEPIIVSDVNSVIQAINKSELIFLEDTSDLHRIANATTALANTSGGVMLIGVNGKAKVKGVNPLDLDSIQQFLTKNISPVISCGFSIIQIRHYFVFKVEVYNSSQLYSFLDVDLVWKRSMVLNNTVVVANEVIEVLLKLKVEGDFINNVSSLCCESIMEELSSTIGISLSRITSKSSFKRSEVVYNLAYLLFMKKARIVQDNAKLNYFSF